VALTGGGGGGRGGSLSFSSLGVFFFWGGGPWFFFFPGGGGGGGGGVSIFWGGMATLAEQVGPFVALSLRLCLGFGRLRTESVERPGLVGGRGRSRLTWSAVSGADERARVLKKHAHVPQLSCGPWKER